MISLRRGTLVLIDVFSILEVEHYCISFTSIAFVNFLLFGKDLN